MAFKYSWGANQLIQKKRIHIGIPTYCCKYTKKFLILDNIFSNQINKAAKFILSLVSVTAKKGISKSVFTRLTAGFYPRLQVPQIHNPGGVAQFYNILVRRQKEAWRTLQICYRVRSARPATHPPSPQPRRG